ncbi:MAG: pyrimidine-nucleoside phosphorylase [Bacteroidetes bacterium]|nr:MAG: pyrimidine-nucleoside phosphorylase [Bacteroidota bacterium]
MNLPALIQKKRDGSALTKEEIRYIIEGYTAGHIPDYQVAALLMAIYFRGMDMEEILSLTRAMLESGATIDLSDIPGPKVDKHSTGGVGDKTSLVLGPLVAAAGVKVAKLSGRGLGYSGGTIDKLESFKGFSVEMSRQQFVEQVKNIGIALSGQSKELVPADKKLYALRDVTATVDSLPLIASSIMSKKLASGAEAIVLDVKTGSGSFNGSLERAIKLANLLVSIGESMGRRTLALVSDMEQPLGHAVGNALEVQEAIACLRGKGPADLSTLCLELGTHMLTLSGAVPGREVARQKIQQVWQSGQALEVFRQLVAAQGGDPRPIDEPALFPQASIQREFRSPKTGWISRISAREIGLAALELGAGRKVKGEPIDLSAGIFLPHKVGAQVKKGQVLARLHSNRAQAFGPASELIAAAFEIGSQQPEPRPIIWAEVDAAKVKKQPSSSSN